MPEGHGGHGGGNRRPQPRRALFTVVGIVVLLIAALAFANRGDHPRADAAGGSPGSTSGSTSGSGSATAGGSTGTRQSAAAPTAPTGDKPVGGKTAGIPSGYAHTDQGAQSAAANFAVVLGSAEMFDAARRHDIVTAIYDPAVRATIQGDLDRAYSADSLKGLGLEADGTAPAGFTFVSRTVPVGTKVTANTGDAMTVEVWCTDLVGLAGSGSTKPVSTAWFTITEKLVWAAGDWKIKSSGQKEGPAPVAADNQASTADEISGAVRDYGGFTYAR